MPFDIYNYIVNDFNLRQMHYDAVIKDGLVMHLEPAVMNTIGGSSIPDITGDTSGATLTNGASFVSGSNAGYINYDGDNDYARTVSDHDDTGNSAISVFCWTRSFNWGHKEFNSIKNAFVFSKRDPGSSGTNNHWQINIKDFKITLNIWDSSNTSIVSSSHGSSLLNNVWYHMGFTTEGNASDSYNVYLDGSSIGSGTLSNARHLGAEQITFAEAPWNIGFLSLRGLVSTFVIYNRVLSSSEVFDMYNAQKARFDKS